MRIGLNLLFLIPGMNGGTETYAAGLLHGFSRIAEREEFVVFVNRESSTWPLPATSNFKRVVCPITGRSLAKRIAFEQLSLSRYLKSSKVDLIHSLGYFGPLYVPCPAVVTVHDVHWRRYGDHRFKRWLQDVLVGRVVNRAQHIIAVSDFARKEIIAAFAPKADKISVIHEAPRIRQGGGACESRCLPDIKPIIFAYTSKAPNKNISRLIDAFKLARERLNLPHHLVLVGHNRVSDRSHSADARIHFTGYQDDTAVDELLHRSQMLVFPSIYEGFGLPVLEAMAAGIPVVCSNAASLPEVAGGAAILFDPFSVEDMASQIGRVALDSELQQRLSASGKVNLKRFSWEKAARETLDIYRRVANV